ncbi:MAG: hypothetical protein HC911_10155 [Chloroflexaceae bacterium]|nr:hypothetical protein [Chloroflexaceae bacterium]
MTTGMPISSAPQMVQLQCPNCNTPFTTEIFTLVDVTADPSLKGMFLSGQVNVAVCPACGFASRLGTPLAYHDAEKQLFLIDIPSELELPVEDQERFIGAVSSSLMQSLPEGASRSHLFTPQRFMSLQSLVDAVLDAEGISREVRDRQRRIVDVLSMLAEAAASNDDALFSQTVTTQRDALDTEFFTILNIYIEASQREQRDETAMLLTLVRDKLATQGFAELIAKAGTQLGANGANGAAATDEPDEGDLEAILARLEAADTAQLEGVLAEIRPFIDYAFFDLWTARIEAATQAGDSDRAAHLTTRRQQILETVTAMDQQAQAMFEAGSAALQEVLAASDDRAALEALGERLDDAFLMVLAANAAAAQREGHTELLERFEQLGTLAVEVIQAKLTPEERLINELMMAETARDSTRILRSNAKLVTPELIKQFNELADSHAQRGSSETAEQLRRFAREAGAMLF